MANYQGLNCIMREITIMASDEKNPIHEQHIYDYFTVTEKFVRTAVPQLVADYLDQFREKLVVEFETYFNARRCIMTILHERLLILWRNPLVVRYII